MSPTIWTMHLPGWQPAPVNRLLKSHWGDAHRMKEKDKLQIATAVQLYGVPKATGKRRVGMLLILGKGQRACDPDSQWKSLLDALTASGVLVDDNRQWCELEPVAFARGDAPGTFITLQEVG